VTLKEAVYGFLLGSVAGVILGVALGQSPFLADVIGPYIKIVNAIPRIVLGSIFIVAFGVGATPKVLLSAVLVFFVVFFNAFQGVREVDRNVVDNAKVLGGSPLQIVRHVTVPSALTWITASLHSAFGFAIVGALVGEVLGAQRGLGLIIKTSQNRFDPDGVFACMLVIAVVTLGAEYLIGLLETRLLSWRPPATTDTPGI
jgi:NitT/TauT family transport system permease protein